MFKRTEIKRDNEHSVPAKRPKYEDPNIFSQSSTNKPTYNMPSTSKHVQNSNANTYKTKPFVQMSQYNSQNKEEDNLNDLSTIVSVDYNEFENKLMHKKVYNSTFQQDENTISELKNVVEELKKLKADHKKLLDNFITKEGENVFLRNQLQQSQLRAENDKLDKARSIEEQEKRHRLAIVTLCKEKEQVKTQLKLKTFEAESLLERCKLLENGHVKLREPHTASLSASLNKSRVNPSVSRSPIPSRKTIKVRESCVQTNMLDESVYMLDVSNQYFPLAEIPKSIYDMPQPEKSVIDIKITERIGPQKLPILQEQNKFRIFEKPELIKPVATMIDDKKLTVEFVLAEVAALQQKTSLEIEAEHTVPMINKLISTSRELLLNILIVLQTISQAMGNDDIRDVNDIYFSDLYATSDYNGKCVCSPNAWHEHERAVEARRIFGLLSYVASESTYLSKYVAGKIRLRIESDESYKSYSPQMIRYNSWEGKDSELEMLTMILHFITLVGSTRRSYQFSGLICAILMLICNVSKKVEYCSQGIELIYRIFKETVFCRPLPYCYSFLSSIMMIFVRSTTYLRKLCTNSQSIAVDNWKDSLHFTPDACALQIFLVQVEIYNFDPILAIDITDVLLRFAQFMLQTDVIPLRSESFCNCCMKLLRCTINLLCDCSRVDLASIKEFNIDNCPVPRDYPCVLKSVCTKHNLLHTQTNSRCILDIYQDKFSDVNVRTNITRRQGRVLRDGIKFLSHLAICDPDFVIRFSDIEDSFHMFMMNLNAFENFHLHENEQEAMNRIKQTFIFDKTLQSQTDQHEGDRYMRKFSVMSHFEKASFPSSTVSKRSKDLNKILLMFRSLLNER
ncbi:uncharacterized protein LOC108624518 isoform X2 [Ceratina calcarata]|uniref:Uncharacterized protein LOC108624518 isoform X2 n=1 Tax=Ceratina calcarata TaxID=156304 RepID=A0AAJ7S052_9HYME|nr:uncharacterized protein LOC108624518 isoform X2 [Ceratina calcarata]